MRTHNIHRQEAMKTDDTDIYASMDEIILDPKGNTYYGPLAQRFLFGEFEIPKIFKIDSAAFHVFEARDGVVTHRASQSSMRAARSYMNADRVLVYNRHNI